MFLATDYKNSRKLKKIQNLNFFEIRIIEKIQIVSFFM